MEEAQRYLKHITQDRGMLAQIRPEITSLVERTRPLIGHANFRFTFGFIRIDEEEHP